MCHAVLQYPAFFRFLTRIDEELALATRLRGCRACGGPLHVADYPRKPRGCPAAVQEAYSRRLSFTGGRCEQLLEHRPRTGVTWQQLTSGAPDAITIKTRILNCRRDGEAYILFEGS